MVDQEHALDLGQPGDDGGEGAVERGLRGADGVRAHAADEVDDTVDDVVLAFEHLGGVLAADFGGAEQVLLGAGEGAAEVQPGGHAKEGHRQDDGASEEEAE